MFKSTMQDVDLTITSLFRHGARVYADSEVITFMGDTTRRHRFSEIAERAARLASALQKLGVKAGDRVATLCWNTHEHLEAYFAVPCMGAILHTLNLRLFPEQLTYIINHAEDKVLLVHDSLLPLLARIQPSLKTVENIVVIGRSDPGLPFATLDYEALLQAESGEFEWPELAEKTAASMCYTSGTTGNPKGVVYSHRSTYLHSLLATSGSIFGLSERDRILPIVPMFHVNAWGLPYAAWMAGADMLMPSKFLQAEPLCRMIEQEKPTFAASVPSLWNDILRHSETKAPDFSSLRMVVCGGSSVPRALMERFENNHGLRIVQAWGMTETSPIAAVAHPPRRCCKETEMEWRAKTGRIVPGVELRLVSDGAEQPWDGESIGEIEVRGPWITGSYYGEDSTEKFNDGWLRTGDVGVVDQSGFVQITDRAKDVIKSGGEWISSVELENALMAHPDVLEASVIGVKCERWDERPLACVVLREGVETRAEQLKDFLAAKVVKWWLPERWSFVREIPKTSVGKFDKKELRARFSRGELTVQAVGQFAPQ